MLPLILCSTLPVPYERHSVLIATGMRGSGKAFTMLLQWRVGR